jgi:hypothetical protein
MYLWPFVILTAAVLLLLFLPDLLPRCSCCGRLKPRPFIRLHKPVGLNPGYGGNRSVCIKCCRKYDISVLSDLDRLNGIKRRLRLEALKKELNI